MTQGWSLGSDGNSTTQTKSCWLVLLLWGNTSSAYKSTISITNAIVCLTRVWQSLFQFVCDKTFELAFQTWQTSQEQYYIIQICHASVGIMMECLPEWGWFSRGRSPKENHPPEGRHSIRIPTLAWYIWFIIPNKPHFGEISIKNNVYNAKVADDWWFTHSPLGVTSDNVGHEAHQWTWWNGQRSSSDV